MQARPAFTKILNFRSATIIQNATDATRIAFKKTPMEVHTPAVKFARHRSAQKPACPPLRHTPETGAVPSLPSPFTSRSFFRPFHFLPFCLPAFPAFPLSKIHNKIHSVTGITKLAATAFPCQVLVRKKVSLV